MLGYSRYVRGLKYRVYDIPAIFQIVSIPLPSTIGKIIGA
jgi:hypothetical protein